MRLLITIGLALAAGAALLLAAIRLPAVEDALFDRALAGTIGADRSALFDGDGVKIFFCGTGSPLPSATRAQTCTAIFAGDKFFLVDSGSGSWENIPAAGIPGGRLGGVFLTHFHSDHIGDLSEANLASWVLGRPAKLSVYGPAGVERVVNGHNEAFAIDALHRTAHHGEGVAPPATSGMTAVPYDGSVESVVYDADGLKVTAFPVKHDPVVPAVGYRFDYKGRSLVVSGDTAYSEELVRMSKGADVLIHEAQANHMVAKMRKAAVAAGSANTAQILADIPSYHTTPEEAARAANEAEVDWLVLTHLTPGPDNAIAERIFMRGVSKVRPGNIRVAKDRMLVVLPEGGGVRFGRL
ncbi:MAG: MBL fold metallo-hydrolase [Pseudomonadota bacterium]|nr:MBL fold metallo-hydrolase [Pseudomonadota bacterium]